MGRGQSEALPRDRGSGVGLGGHQEQPPPFCKLPSEKNPRDVPGGLSLPSGR